MNSTAAIYARLTAASAITSALDTWNGLPAIFDDRAPDEYLAQQDKACIVIAFPTDDADASTFSETIRAIAQDVRVYAKATGDNAPLDGLARAVRDLFHLQASQIEVEDGSCSLATATGPVAAPTTDPSLVGRRVQLRLQLRKD